jgi:hypothetical protein
VTNNIYRWTDDNFQFTLGNYIYKFRQNGRGKIYKKLDWGVSTVLVVVRLGLGRDGRNAVVGVGATRGVGGNVGVGRVEVVLFVVG